MKAQEATQEPIPVEQVGETTLSSDTIDQIGDEVGDAVGNAVESSGETVSNFLIVALAVVGIVTTGGSIGLVVYIIRLRNDPKAMDALERITMRMTDNLGASVPKDVVGKFGGGLAEFGAMLQQIGDRNPGGPAPIIILVQPPADKTLQQVTAEIQALANERYPITVTAQSASMQQG